MAPFARILLLATAVTAGCIKPQGDWKLTQGNEFDPRRASKLERGISAGGVIHELGSPFSARERQFLYAMQHTRPVVRDWIVYARPYTQQVTVKTLVYLDDGVVAFTESKRIEQLLPRRP